MKRWLAVAGTFLGLAVAAWAQAATPLHAKASVNWPSPGVPVSDALRDLGAQANVEFAFDAALLEHLDLVTLKMDEVAAGRIAMRILYPRGLKLEDAGGRRPRVVKADPYDELRPKREENFDFARKPTLTRHGDDVTIAFETKGWCDVTIAIEHGGGIVRHLASGVLGLNAPEPFVWNSKAQTVVWDGKDDAGAYVDDKDAVTVRVSLGLKPRFERTLFWHPAKEAGRDIHLAAGEEGVYVFQGGQMCDHVRLFDRDGNYVRTVYPFPNRRLEQIQGLHWRTFPDGVRLPIKPDYNQATMLQFDSPCSSPTYNPETKQYRGKGDSRYGIAHGRHWSAGGPMAVAGGRIALVSSRLIRLPADEPHRLPLFGALVTLNSENHRLGSVGRPPLPDSEYLIWPRRAALSPDGQWLYLTMYNHLIPAGLVRSAGNFKTIWHHKVYRTRYEGDERPVLFAGGEQAGDKDGQFNMPADVATDAQGRVYVADHLNDRIQVFDSEGKHLRNIPAEKPARLHLHRKTGEIFVFSWALPVSLKPNVRGVRASVQPEDRANKHYRLTKYASLDDGAAQQDSWDLQAAAGLERTVWLNTKMDAVIDDGSDPVRVWITKPRRGRFDLMPTLPFTTGGVISRDRGFLLLTLEDGRWTLKKDAWQEAARAIVRPSSPIFQRQRLYVNPVDGVLYMAEDVLGHSKAFDTIVRIDPETGRIREIKLPHSAEDMAFDRDGHAYLRTSDQVMRYTADFQREIPFDYGEERARTGYSTGRTAPVISGAVFVGNTGFHQGGMHVNARGDIAIGARYRVRMADRKDEAQVHVGYEYQPAMYPGRYRSNARVMMLINVLDRHGRLKWADAVPGLSCLLNGTAIDARGDVYVLETAMRMYGGEPYFNDCVGTVMKFTPGQARLRSPGRAPVPLEQHPARAQDLRWGGTAWVEGAHWFYGGVGWGGFNPPVAGGCGCPNARFALDDFARSITPEIDRYNVGVVDSAGNLILRVGRPGNVDDGLPLVKEGGPANPRSIGPSTDSGQASDEVALMFAPYVATHTDRRLFIADPGNARIVSVKLGYHADEKVALKGVPDGAK